MSTLTILFWVFLFIVFYTYLGYGILLYILVKIKELFKKPVKMVLDEKSLPKVTLLIAAYNEEDVIEEKMKNTLEIDYPAELFEIVWVTDGSTDNTYTLLEPFTVPVPGRPAVKVLFDPARRGKTAALNRAMPFIETPIVVFTDANTMINAQAVKEMVLQFQNPKVGCVAGEKRVVSQTKNGAAASEGIYWKYESTLKKLDWRLYSAVGAAGELYAIRRPLFEPMPDDTLLDDFILSMKIAQKGNVIAYCDTAYAQESGSLNIHEEKKRKVRIAAGGIQSIARLTPLFNCFRYPVLSFQYVSHRVLRWSITPILLLSLLPINIALFFSPGVTIIYTVLLILQILFYIMALCRVKIPYYFLFMNLNVISGFFYLCRKKGKSGVWEKAKRQ